MGQLYWQGEADAFCECRGRVADHAARRQLLPLHDRIRPKVCSGALAIPPHSSLVDFCWHTSTLLSPTAETSPCLCCRAKFVWLVVARISRTHTVGVPARMGLCRGHEQGVQTHPAAVRARPRPGVRRHAIYRTIIATRYHFRALWSIQWMQTDPDESQHDFLSVLLAPKVVTSHSPTRINGCRWLSSWCATRLPRLARGHGPPPPRRPSSTLPGVPAPTHTAMLM